MGQWQPLADRIPLDVRRLTTQLRRMKDRSGMTVPALAARTAQSAEVWEKAFSGRELPPLDAVEVLAQASGADYDRIGALWELAEKASNGTGDRGRGRPLPKPDPLDPLGPSEGLPGRRKRVLLLATAGALAVAALIAVILTAGTSTGRAPGRQDAAPTATGQASAPGAAPGAKSKPTAGARGGTGGSVPDGTGAASAGPDGTAGADRPVPAMGALSPPAGAPGATRPGPGSTQATGSAGADPTGAVPTVTATGGRPGTGGSATPPSAPPSSAPDSPPAASSSPLCLKVIVLGICLG